MNVIEIGGARFIRASDAARQVGYASDYIGQLARAGKIQGHQIGRTWYVKEDDILGHKTSKPRSNKRKTQEHVRAEISAPHAIYNSLIAPSSAGDMPEYRKRLLASPVHYEQDLSPLTLSVRRGAEEHAHALPITADTDEELVHATHLGRDLVIAAEATESTLEAERAPEPPMHGEIPLHEETEYTVAELDHVHEIPTTLDDTPSLTLFEQRLGEYDNGGNSRLAEKTYSRTAGDMHSHSTNEGHISHIPLPGRRMPLGLERRSPMALVPVALVLALIFVTSSLFVEKVIVYQRGKLNSEPHFAISYGMVQMATVLQALSR